jgi:hypothetical protein
MSKIMRLMYAEARAAREAAANPSGHRNHDMQAPVPNPVAFARSTIEWWTIPVLNPVASARSTIEWWTSHIAKAERFRQGSHQGKSATP